jgi:uncharacterized YccA/Bax inhibitor family protein
MRSGNPALSESTFLDLASGSVVSSPDQVMTINGTVNKTGILLLLTVHHRRVRLEPDPRRRRPDRTGRDDLRDRRRVGGLILALVTVFKKEWSPVTAPMYALVEGFFLGAISAVFEARFPGIVFQAVLLTFGTLFALLAAYRSGLIKVTENFKIGVVAATGGIALLYLASFVLSFFNINVPVIHEASWLGIAFSLFVVVVAALNLVLDFDFIETGAAARAPKYMEWYGAFGLMVTLVWLYVEFLRLLSKLQSR